MSKVEPPDYRAQVDRCKYYPLPHTHTQILGKEYCLAVADYLEKEEKQQLRWLASVTGEAQKVQKKSFLQDFEKTAKVDAIKLLESKPPHQEIEDAMRIYHTALVLVSDIC